MQRRTFVRTSAAAWAASSLWTPHLAIGSTAGAANPKKIGCIGTGGRCRHLLKSLVGRDDVRIEMLCDVRDDALAETSKMVGGSVPTTKDYRKLLDQKDLDAVVIASSDHWHVPLTIAACASGKHIYVEKPLTHSREEGKAVIDAVQKSGCVVQVGMQQRSMPHIAEAAKRIQAGDIGDIVKVHMSWNRNTDRVRRFKGTLDPAGVDWKGFLGSAPEQPYDEYRMRNWRWYWDFGGGIFTDLMVHWIDVAQWILRVQNPIQAVSIGQFVHATGIWETPDTVQTLLTYDQNLQMHFEGTFANAKGGAGITLMGTLGNIQIDRGGYILQWEAKSKKENEERILGTGPRFADFYDQPDGEKLHLNEWLQAIDEKREPNAPVTAGVSSAAAAHLANEALKSGVARW